MRSYDAMQLTFKRTSFLHIPDRSLLNYVPHKEPFYGFILINKVKL